MHQNIHLMKVTFIGAGTMGGAVSLGLAASGAVRPEEITVTARSEKSLRKFKNTGINTCRSNAEAVKGADIIFYAVKPWQMEGVMRETAPSIDFKRQMIVSIAPGVKEADIFNWMSEEGGKPSLAYVIPNTAVEIGESMTFIVPVSVSDGQVKILEKLFRKVGRVEVVESGKLLAGTSVASCGIAYAMRYISASEKGAEMLGLDKNSIRKVVCQTVRGASELISRHKSEPEREIDRVTTPNGLTIKGLYAMEDAGFSESVVKGLTVNTAPRHRIVVKVGSNVLTRQDGALNTTRVSDIVDQIVSIRNLGYDVVLVTSGAVACGRSLIKQNRKLDEVQQRQLFSALGQVRLMDLYYKLFIDYGINVGQILTMKNSFERKRDYATQRECMEVMLSSGVIPIVNENDAVAIKELMFTDNDELSSLVASMIGAEKLIILSNIDGIYDGDPAGPGSKVIGRVSPDDDVTRFISPSKSKFGRGGMVSKCSIAMRTAASGIKVIIANCNRGNILVDLLTRPEETVHTEFDAIQK